MHKNKIPILFLFFLLPLFLPGQCPEKKWLWNRIAFLKDSSGLSYNSQLKELLKTEAVVRYCDYQNDSVRVLLLQRIGTLFLDNAEYEQAVYYIRKAIGLVSDNIHSPFINPVSLVRNYYNLALIYSALNKTSEKIRAYDSCIATAQRLNVVNLHYIDALLEKVKYLDDIGDYNLCVSYAAIGETVSRQYVPEKGMSMYGDATGFSLNFVIQKVNALLVLKRADEAELLLNNKITECKKGEGKEYLGSLYEQLAMTKMQKKNYKEVIYYFNQALRHNSKQGYTLSCKVNIHNIGYFLYDEIFKDDNKALSYYRKALGYVNTDPSLNKLDSIISVKIYNNIANVYVRKRKYDSAQFFFQRAFDQIKKGTNETEVINSPLDEFFENQKVSYLTELFIDKGDGFNKEYQTTQNPLAIKEAIRIYKLTDILLESIQKGQSEQQSKLFWRKDTHHLYEQAINACITAGRPEDAFYFFERSRSILLYDQITQLPWLGEHDITEQQNLTNKINQLERELRKADSSSAHYADLQKKWFGFKEKQVHLRQVIKERNPLYYQRFLDSGFTSVYDIRQTILQDHQALVEIFAGDSSTWSMIVTAHDISFNRIDKSAYDSAVSACISYMSDPVSLNKNSRYIYFIKSSRRLYDLIFQNKLLPEGRIIISPDGRYFPFEALITGFNNNEPVYFLEKHAVSYTYSARYLMNEFNRPTKILSGNFLGIAPVKFPEKQKLSILWGSDLSVENLKAFFSASENLLQEKATRNNFLKKFGRYQVIQLYTHSSDSSSEGEPVIYFADDPLYLSELSNIVPPITKLIVLSACETGNGEFYQGEGVFSFNRAFAALGIPSSITNLWSVDNESTYKLTELFYKQLSYGLTIDKAMQQAKLEFIKTSSDKKRLPYYWAASILAGKTDAIRFRKAPNYRLLPTLIAVAMGGIFVWWLMRRRGKRDGV